MGQLAQASSTSRTQNQNGESRQSNGGGRRQKAREAQTSCCQRSCQWKGGKEGGQDECQEREENVGQDDQEQEDCRRVLKSQTKGFREHDRKTGKELLLISLKIIVWIKY